VTHAKRSISCESLESLLNAKVTLAFARAHVRAAQAKVEKNRVLEVVRGISTQKKLCLYATAAVASQTADGTARSTTGYRVYQYLTDAIDADQYHQRNVR